MYSLFIDTLSSPAFICLFDDERIIRDSFSWEGKHAEFNTLIESIDSLLKRNAQTFSEIAKIICIV
jgi:tRNA A37 threonylcarbamoyladenosine modification protein TsaB